MVIPKHVAIILDGNGRWAKERGKIRLEGHRAGAASLERILRYAGEIGVKYLTVYAFSTENWKRPKMEVEGLMNLFSRYLDNKKKELKKQGVKLLVTGAKENISEKNSTFNELTLTYWAWKNSMQDYIGFGHYRRYFVYNRISLLRRIFLKITKKNKTPHRNLSYGILFLSLHF